MAPARLQGREAVGSFQNPIALSLQEMAHGHANEAIIFDQKFVMKLELQKGATAFKPFEWQIGLAGVADLNVLDVFENAAVDPDVRDGTSRTTTHVALQEAFVELHLADLSTRYDFISRLQQLGQEPASTGFLPYAIVETFQELKLAFAEYRRWPDNPRIQSKILIIAGHLAHYAGDLCQPLHTTIHHDGRTKLGAGSPNTGIHFAVDGLIEATSIVALATESRPAPVGGEDLLTAVQPLRGDFVIALVRQITFRDGEGDQAP